jgi:hypothetical protein
MALMNEMRSLDITKTFVSPLRVNDKHVVFFVSFMIYIISLLGVNYAMQI